MNVSFCHSLKLSPNDFNYNQKKFNILHVIESSLVLSHLMTRVILHSCWSEIYVCNFLHILFIFMSLTFSHEIKTAFRPQLSRVVWFSTQQSNPTRSCLRFHRSRYDQSCSPIFTHRGGEQQRPIKCKGRLWGLLFGF